MTHRPDHHADRAPVDLTKTRRSHPTQQPFDERLAERRRRNVRSYDPPGFFGWFTWDAVGEAFAALIQFVADILSGW